MTDRTEILTPKAVIGTNAWGGALYDKALRGSYVGRHLSEFHSGTAGSCRLEDRGSSVTVRTEGHIVCMRMQNR